MRVPTVVIELDEHLELARDIAAGRVFITEWNVEVDLACELIVRGVDARTLRCPGRVVSADPPRGVALELTGLTTALKLQLAEMVSEVTAARVGGDTVELGEALVLEDAGRSGRTVTVPPPVFRHPSTDFEGPTLRRPVDRGFVQPAAAAVSASIEDELRAYLAAEEPADELALETAAPAEPVAEGDEDDEADEADEDREPTARNVHERLRGLTLAEQVRTAHSSDPQERIALERIYGKNVWEPLLRNPRLTSPEVVRLARMGNMPRVLVEVIVSNGAWMSIPEVRRALLTNPRLGADQIPRVLRAMPKHELKLASTQAIYPMAVRDAAKKLMRGA